MNYFDLALRNIIRNRRRSLMTVIAVAVGLAAVVLFGGYVNSTYAGLEEQAVIGERLGHLTIQKRGMSLEGKLRPRKYMFTPQESARLVDIVRSDARVRMLTPRLSVSGIFSNGNASTIFIGEGLVAKDMEMFKGKLLPSVRGKLDHDNPIGAAVASDLAKLMKLQKGASASVLTSTFDGQANALDLEIVDLFDTGNAGTNDKYTVVPFSFAQRLLDTDGVERYVVLLDDIAHTEAARADLLQRLQAGGFDVEVKTWRELSSFYLQVRNLFNMIFTFIASIVGVVIAMSIVNTMSMTVFERTREIGTLRAVGLRARRVIRLFCTEGMVLSLIGGAAGLLIALATAFAMNSAQLTYTPPNSSSPVALTIDLHVTQIAAVLALIVAIATVSALWPAYRASRKEIVAALGYV
jgi:putative ABC transport system permease protein